MLYSYELFLTQLGARLRQLRLDRGLTLRNIIVDHGFHLAQWQAFEKGKGISVPSLLRICAVFDVSLEALVGKIGLLEEQAAAPEPKPKARTLRKRAGKTDPNASDRKMLPQKAPAASQPKI